MRLSLFLLIMSWLMVDQLGNSLAVLLAFVCFVIVAVQKASTEQRLASVYIVFSILSCLGYWGLPHSNGNLMVLVLSTKLKYIGSLALGLVFYLTMRYLKIKVPLLFQIVVYSLIIFLFVLVISFDSKPFKLENPTTWGYFCHTWLFKTYKAGWKQGIPYLNKVNNWAHVLYLSLSVCYATVLTAAYCKIFFKRTRTDWKNLVVLYLLIMLPNICYLVDKAMDKVMGNTMPLQTVPIGMVISDCLFVYLICLRKFCDVSDLASNAFFEMMETPAFVVDSRSLLVNVNQNARKYFPEITEDMLGRDIFTVLPKSLEPVADELMLLGAEETGLEPVIPENDDNLIYCNDIYFQPKIFTINSGSVFQGYIIWLEDVTALKKDSAEKIRTMRDKMILGFSSLAENHDFSTQGHLHRTAAYARAIAQELYEQHMFRDQINRKFIDTIEQVAPLHDIGKTYIDRELFNKPKGFTDDEKKIMHQHTTLGAQFLEEILKDLKDTIYVQMAIDITLYHHEWWNGTGYPYGLKQENIPLSARIMAVADTFDALVTERPYKPPYSCEDAFEIIQNESGTHFEPAIVLCFLSISDKIKQIKSRIELEDMSLEEIE